MVLTSACSQKEKSVLPKESEVDPKPTKKGLWRRRAARGSISADCLWEVGMLISPALAHGTSGAGSVGGFGPLILLAVAIVFVLVLVGEAKWRRRKQRRDDSDNLRHR